MNNQDDEQFPYGYIETVDKQGRPAGRVGIADYLRAEYADHRLLSVLGLADGTVAIGVENPPSTGRSTQQTMRLSLESLGALVMSTILYFSARGIRFDEFTQQVVGREQIHFQKSPNLEDPDLERDMPGAAPAPASEEPTPIPV